jgi:uncharacterized DUF497 family protein
VIHDFRWIDWNRSKIDSHGVSVEECEFVVNHNDPTQTGEKFKVFGATRKGKWIQVVYLLDDNDDVFVIHARPLNTNERWRHR